MANDIDMKMIGVEALQAKLKAVTVDVRKKGGRASLRKAANIIRNAAIDGAQKLNDPNTPEDISKNIVVRFSNQRFKKTGDLQFRIGVIGGARKYADDRWNRAKRRAGKAYSTDGDKGNPGGDTWYWRLLEFGTSKMAAKPFMRPALAQNIGKATAEFIKEYSKALDRAIKRAGK